MSEPDLQRQINELRDIANRAYMIEVPRWIYLTTPLTSTSWDGDSFSTTAKTLIDLSAVFAVPSKVRAILARVSLRDSGSATTDCQFFLSPNDIASNGILWRSHGIGNDGFIDGTFPVPCNADGDVYYQVVASGASTMDVWLEIWGYLI